MSREHVAPQWLRKSFPDLSDVEYERAFQVAGGEIEAHRRPGVPFDQTVKGFCLACNVGWMAALEQEVEPILTPLIQNQPRTLDASQQQRIAVWATKTVLVFGPTNPGGVTIAPGELYRWFGRWQMPLPSSLVWLARYTGTEQWPISYHHHALVIAREDKPTPSHGSATNGFHSVLALGPLVICVFLADVPEGPVVSGGSSSRRALIWPSLGPSVRWPPTSPISTVAQLRTESRLTPYGTAAPLPPT